MKKVSYILLFLFSYLLLISSCSTKKDTLINRNLHSLSSKYNVLYNGNLTFDQAKEALDATYEDNYWERLPIEPIEIKDEIQMPGQAAKESDVKQGFEKSEEKAVKAVQKHSMLIDGLERNNQIDDAYLLLGKSRYYSQRFVPALEAFTYSIENYQNANLYYETKIWKAKTHIRLQNEELAIETLKTISRNVDLPDETLEKAHTSLAMAYTQLDSTQQVIDNLKNASYYFVDRNQGARNLFILGQIYREEGKIDSSNMAFEALMYQKKIPHKYQIHAQLERAKNYQNKDSTQAIIFALRELIEERENKPYYDELYYQAGLIALKKEDTILATQFFDSSLLNNTSKPHQKSLAYEGLGNIYFDQAKYPLAGAYYDSVLQIKNVDPNTRRMRKILRKNESLENVILYENVLKRNDSILYVAGLSESDQKLFFENYVAELQRKEEELKFLEDQQQSTAGFGEFNNVSSKQGVTDGTFYFYNVQIVGFGIQEFKRKYGNRPLQDNWIISNRNVSSTESNMDKLTTVVDANKKFDVNYYLEDIPKGTQIDSISNLRNDAYYNLGLLYKEKFKEYDLAAINFEKYLNSNPNPKLVLPVKYQLYKSYENFDPVLSNKYKDDIVINYPSSRYAQIINNPKKVIDKTKQENSPEKIYENVFVCYEEGEYEYAFSTINEAKEQFEGSIVEAKFELLKAFLLIKTEGEEAFKKQLDFVIINFPNTVESEHAKRALEILSSTKNK